MRQIDAIKRFRVRGLAAEVHHFWNGTLHAKRQFVRRHACGKSWIVRIVDGPKAVEFAKQIDANRLRLSRERALGPAKVEWIVGIDAQRHCVMSGTKVVPIASVPVFAGPDRDELRALVAERA